MDLEFIERVVRLVEKADIGELEIESEDGLRVSVKKAVAPTAAPQAPIYVQGPAGSSAPAPAPSGSAESSSVPQGDAADPNIEVIKAPMVGTFYKAPAPDAPPFVESGNVVQKNTIVCILEAMKVMNEIKANTAGIITEVLVENGQPVEFGQPLFKLRKQ